MLAVIFKDWLRHKLLPARAWGQRRFGRSSRARPDAREPAAVAGLAPSWGVLVYLWAASSNEARSEAAAERSGPRAMPAPYR